MKNPFNYGNPVSDLALIGRQREIRRIASRLNTGQSVAIIAEPRMGKTSMLEYVKSPKTRGELFEGQDLNKLFFVYLDAQALGENFNQSDFWQYILAPLEDILETLDSGIRQAYTTCQESGFTTFNLERMLAHMQAEQIKIIILLDQFENILYLSGLNKSEFYGGLRALVSRYSGAITLLITSRMPLSSLNQRTQEFSRTGSPYFNFIQEMILPPFSQKAVDELLSRADPKFSGAEKQYIRSLAGGHPFFLQCACSSLWESYAEKQRSKERLKYTAKQLYTAAELVMSNTWQMWSPELRKVFAIVALDEMPLLLGETEFDLIALRKTLKNYEPELRYLNGFGFIQADAELPSGWRTSAQVTLWWLADILVLALRNNDELGKFLSEEQWEGLFAKGEKNQLLKSVQQLGELAKLGAESFIKAAAEGFGRGLSSSTARS